jgi:hypothetical protein
MLVLFGCAVLESRLGHTGWDGTALIVAVPAADPLVRPEVMTSDFGRCRAWAYSCPTMSTGISTAGIVPLFSSQCVVFLSSGQPTPCPYSVATPFR